jgi:hypothetical protein
MHVNQQARDAVAAALDALSFTIVRTTSAEDLLDVDMPSALVLTPADTVEPWSKGPPPEELRTVALGIILAIEGEPETLQADLDALRVQVEPVVATALTSIARHVRHTGGESETLADEEGERWFAFLALAWDVEIVTALGDPETALL